MRPVQLLFVANLFFLHYCHGQDTTGSTFRTKTSQFERYARQLDTLDCYDDSAETEKGFFTVLSRTIQLLPEILKDAKSYSYNFNVLTALDTVETIKNDLRLISFAGGFCSSEMYYIYWLQWKSGDSVKVLELKDYEIYGGLQFYLLDDSLILLVESLYPLPVDEYATIDRLRLMKFGAGKLAFVTGAWSDSRFKSVLKKDKFRLCDSLEVDPEYLTCTNCTDVYNPVTRRVTFSNGCYKGKYYYQFNDGKFVLLRKK